MNYDGMNIARKKDKLSSIFEFLPQKNIKKYRITSENEFDRTEFRTQAFQRPICKFKSHII